jgi:sialate O-acetylesterase
MHNTRRRIHPLWLLSLLCSQATFGADKPLLSDVFQDHAVLQREQPVRVWGSASPGESVTVLLDARKLSAKTDGGGRWQVTLPPLKAGGPHVLTVSASGRSQSISDVLAGDVYLCSGQSNMELSVEATTNAAREISSADNGQIRLFKVAHDNEPAPANRFKEVPHWTPVTGQSVKGFSAACFYFARELQKTEAVPLGLIQSTWGGSRIEPWISAEGLKAFPAMVPRLQLLQSYAASAERGQREMGVLWEQWWHQHEGSSPWSDAEDGQWRAVPEPLRDWKTWGVPELAQHDGMVWFRRSFTLTAEQARSLKSLSIGAIDEVDETWLNGKPIANSFGYATERTYAVPPNLLKAGENTLVINVLSTWDAGGMYGPQEHLGFDIGEASAVSLAGSWRYHLASEAMGYPPRAPWESVSGLSTLYNGMISPIAPYNLRGVLWYQGESNAGDAGDYQAYLASLMRDWRAHFQAELPFLIVQLPNFGKLSFAPTESDWANLREAQRLAVAADAHAALSVSIDLGEPDDLHPPNKQSIGIRLARAARHLIYGEAISPSGPAPRGLSRQGNELIVEFGDAEVLTPRDAASVTAFELCADKAHCRFVEASVAGHTVRLGPAREGDRFLRYCWADAPLCNLYDSAALPASPFQLPLP